jgi:hypothetical protein
MHTPILLTKEKLELLHTQLDKWIRARHARMMTAQERSECYRGKIRPCVDYSTLNLECHRVAYPMPDMDGIRRNFAGLDLYIGLNVRAAFNQIMLSRRAGLAMAVIIPGRNRGDPPVIFVPESMGFGHLSSPRSSAASVGDLLTGINHGVQRCRSYLDNMTGGTKGGYKEGYVLFEDIMKRTAASRMLFAFDKLQFLVPELRVLGLLVTISGVEPDPARCEELINWPDPRTTKEVQGYTGMFNWLARNMPLSTTAALRALQASCKHKFEWTDKLRDAFATTEALGTSWILAAPFDPGKETIIQTDRSAHAMGWVLGAIAVRRQHQGAAGRVDGQQGVAGVGAPHASARARERGAHVRDQAQVVGADADATAPAGAAAARLKTAAWERWRLRRLRQQQSSSTGSSSSTAPAP